MLFSNLCIDKLSNVQTFFFCYSLYSQLMSIYIWKNRIKIIFISSKWFKKVFLEINEKVIVIHLNIISFRWDIVFFLL